MNKKIYVGAFVGMLIAVAPFAVSTASAKAVLTTASSTINATVTSQTTIAQLQAQILQLTKQIAVISTRITNLRIAQHQNDVNTNITYPTTTQTNASSRIQKLVIQMQLGSHGEGVTLLQKLLSTDSAIYPSKLVTGYYGRLTEGAVRAFQKKHGIEDVGEVGPKTRAVFNSYLAHATSTMPSNLLREFEREGSAIGGQTQVSVCQLNSQSGKSQTISIAQSTVLAHIERGDSIGSCSSEGEHSQNSEHQSENGNNSSNSGESHDSSSQNNASSTTQSNSFGEGATHGE